MNDNDFNQFVGKTFNRLTITRILSVKDIKGNVLCEATCNCDKHGTIIKPVASIVNGNVKSCGCLRIEQSRKARQINMIGKKFGRLTVIEEVKERNRDGGILYKCKCDCSPDRFVNVLGSNLRYGYTTSCGCYKKEVLAKNRFVDYTGFDNGYITVLRPTDKRKGPNVVWICKCHRCGREFELSSNYVHVRMSCGQCGFQSEFTRNRLTKWKTPEEKALALRFSGMITRCYDKNDANYPDYGGRGIYICKEWTDDRANFVKWSLENGFKLGLSIDRIDNDGPYAPWNCRWIEPSMQANNRRNTRFITANGVTASIANWARVIGRESCTLYNVSMCDDTGDCIQKYIEYVLEKMPAIDRNNALQQLQVFYYGK